MVCNFILGNSGQNKASNLEISQDFDTPLGNSKAKNQDPWKFHMIFSWSPPEFPLLFNWSLDFSRSVFSLSLEISCPQTPPLACFDFFWNSPFLVHPKDAPSAALWLTPSVFSKWKLLRWCTYRASFIDIRSVVLEFWALKYFRTSRVVFWLELLKILSILFEIWPVMTCKMMHQMCYGFYWSIKRWLKLAKNLGFFAHFQMFVVYALLYPMSYTARFCRTKGLIKIYIRVKFHQYSICVCEVKNFQSVLYRFNIHEI